MSLSNYPPGVTGNEPEIAGYPLCGRCGHDPDDHAEDDQFLSMCCGAPAVDGTGMGNTGICAKCRNGSGFQVCAWGGCDCEGYTDEDESEPDPDVAHDRKREQRLFGG